MFTKVEEDGKRTVLIVYVDDIIITGNNDLEIERLKNKMRAAFEVKDLGELKYFLSMEVARSKAGICISQRKYTLDLLKETSKLGCKLANTPLEPNWKNKGDKKQDYPVDNDRF